MMAITILKGILPQDNITYFKISSNNVSSNITVITIAFFLFFFSSSSSLLLTTTKQTSARGIFQWIPILALGASLQSRSMLLISALAGEQAFRCIMSGSTCIGAEWRTYVQSLWLNGDRGTGDCCDQYERLHLIWLNLSQMEHLENLT